MNETDQIDLLWEELALARDLISRFTQHEEHLMATAGPQERYYDQTRLLDAHDFLRNQRSIDAHIRS